MLYKLVLLFATVLPSHRTENDKAFHAIINISPGYTDEYPAYPDSDTRRSCELGFNHLDVFCFIADMRLCLFRFFLSHLGYNDGSFVGVFVYACYLISYYCINIMDGSWFKENM